MEFLQKIIIGTLCTISIVGIIGIPMGDPQFIINAIVLESAFIALIFLSAWRLRYAIAPNIVLAIVVIIGNSMSPKHTEIMSTFVPFENAVVLIVGGYILQGILVITNVIVFKNQRQIEKTS